MTTRQTHVLPAVPTTRILAIGQFASPPTLDQLASYMPSEVTETVRLYLDGKIDQWYMRQDRSGVVFLMNVVDIDEARALLEALPLGKADLMTFDLIPLGPLRPLHFLLPEAVSTGNNK